MGPDPKLGTKKAPLLAEIALAAVPAIINGLFSLGHDEPEPPPPPKPRPQMMPMPTLKDSMQSLLLGMAPSMRQYAPIQDDPTQRRLAVQALRERFAPGKMLG